MYGQNLKELYESDGKVAFCKRMVSLLDKGADKNFRESHSRSEYLLPEDFSIKELWEATVGPCGQTLNTPAGDLWDLEMKESAIDSTAFSVLTGSLLSKKIIAGYDDVIKIGDKLTTSFNSKLKLDDLPGVTDAELPKEVKEGMPYRGSSLEEKWARIGGKKYGRRLDITEETIFFDQTGLVLMRANAIGKKAANYKEKLIIEGVIDKNSNVYKPSGTAQALYSASTTTYPNGVNLKASNALVDETNFKASRALLSAMKDDNGEPVGIPMVKAILVPDDLVETAFIIKNTIKNADSGNNALSPWGPQGLYRNYEILTSPYMDAVSTSDWYMGDPKEQFFWKEIWPLQIFRAKAGNEEEFSRDIKVSIKTRFYGDIGARDTKYFIKNTA